MELDIDHVLGWEVADLVGQRIAVLGISDSGKTNSVSVLAEELLPVLPLTIIDIEGEYFGLKEHFDLLVAGRSEHAEVPLFKENAASLAEVSIARRISIILDLSEYEPEEIQEILLAYFERLWTLAGVHKIPYEVIIEEAHEFVQQGKSTPLKALLTRFALRGRKRGIGVVLASQRSAKVEKDLLTQSNILLLHHVIHPIDLSVYKDLIPLLPKEVEQQVRALGKGAAYVIRGEQVARVQIRKRHTFHAGATPMLGSMPPSLRTIDTSLLEELRAIAARSEKEGGSDEVSKLRRRLSVTETLLIEREAEIAELQRRLEFASTLRVEMPGSVFTPPDSMHIREATIGQMSLPLGSLTPYGESESVAASGVVKELSRPESTFLPLNENKVAALQRWFQQHTTPLHRKMLKVLHQQGSLMSVYEIASWCGCAESMLKNRPPLELVQRGILSRQQQRGGYQYRSSLSAFLAKEFAGCDQEALVARVLAWC